MMHRRARPPRTPWAVVAAVALLLVAPSCSSPQYPLPAGPQRLSLTMREYSFSYPASVARGRLVIRFRNTGRLPHRLVVIPLPPGFPPLRDQLRSPTRAVVSPLADTRDQRPGVSGALAVDLRPGRYAFVCYVVDADQVSHALKGMASEIRVR